VARIGGNSDDLVVCCVRSLREKRDGAEGVK
jgi:hypothetical protein